MDLQTIVGLSTVAIYGMVILAIALSSDKPQATNCDKCKGCNACAVQIHTWNGVKWEKMVQYKNKQQGQK
jgi:hypothetical protein